MVKIVINNTQGRIITVLNLDQLSIISNLCSFTVEGGEYKANEFRRRTNGQCEWDGQRRLFNSQHQTFPIGLLCKITDLFKTVGMQYEIIDERIHLGRKFDIVCSPKERRYYQDNVILPCIMNGSGIIQAATGSGKTTMAGMIISTFGKPTVFIVHTKDLLYQAKESFEHLFGVHIGQIGDGIVDIQDITVATVQSLSKASSIVEYESYKYDEDGGSVDNIELPPDMKQVILKWSRTVGLVLFDEVQRVASRTASSAVDMFVSADNRFGLSASPWRDDGADLMIEGAFGPIIYRISASELIEKGYLVQPNIVVKKVNNNIWSGKDYNAIYKSAVVENPMRNMQICEDAITQYRLGRCTLILITQIKHGEMLQQMIRAYDNTIPVQFISGKSNSKYRKKVIDDMRSGKAPIVIASTIADVGLDVPRLQSIIEGGAGKSSVTALQRVGRAIRKFDDKDQAFYITYRDQAPYLNQQIGRKMEIWRTEPKFIITEE